MHSYDPALTLTMKYKLDLDIVKMYLRTKNKVSTRSTGFDIQQLEHEQDRQATDYR